MRGVLMAITAGVCFGLFQAVNRRANSGIDAYRATFGLLLIGTIALAVVTGLTQPLEELAAAPVSSIAFFAAAGFVHFFVGWTYLALSQQRIGAARTGATAAATPLVGAILAAVVLGESLELITGAGVVLVAIGIAILSLRGMAGTTRRQVPWYGLGAAASWGTSPLFIRWGLEGLDAPLIGVTIGMAAATTAYATSLTVARRWGGDGPIPRANRVWMVVAGLLVAVAIAAQWISYDLIAIAVAITLMQLAAPVVIATAPFIVGTDLERISTPLVVGTTLIMGGSILVVLTG